MPTLEIPTVAPAVSGRVVPRESLTAPQQAAMYSLLDAHFEGVTPRQFRRDLDEKNWVILLEQGGPGGPLVGSSTLLVYETRFENEPLSVVYSGDTIVRRDEKWVPISGSLEVEEAAEPAELGVGAGPRR